MWWVYFAMFMLSATIWFAVSFASYCLARDVNGQPRFSSDAIWMEAVSSVSAAIGVAIIVIFIVLNC